VFGLQQLKIIKKILNHLGLWDIKHKPPSRANGPPTEATIIYDESSLHGADDYRVRRRIIQLKPTSKKPTAGASAAGGLELA